MLETREVPARTATPARVSGERGVLIRPLEPRARFSLRLPENLATLAGFALDLPINRFSPGSRMAARLGPDEWLLIAASEDGPAIAAELEAALAGRFFSLVDIAHRHAAFAVGGGDAEAVLNAGCPLPLDDAAFPVGSATRTVLAKAEVILLRLEAGFELECGRSFAGYVLSFLNEAARDYSALIPSPPGEG